MMSINDVRHTVEGRVPGLHARIETMLAESEARFNVETKQAPSAFLLEHTRRTAAIAHTIAGLEGVDPFCGPGALYHDAGKFHEGGYHQDDVPEEEHAAILAATLLAGSGGQRRHHRRARRTTRLYNDRLPCVGPAASSRRRPPRQAGGAGSGGLLHQGHPARRGMMTR